MEEPKVFMIQGRNLVRELDILLRKAGLDKAVVVFVEAREPEPPLFLEIKTPEQESVKIDKPFSSRDFPFQKGPRGAAKSQRKFFSKIGTRRFV